MKRTLSLILALVMALSLAACGAKGDSKTENSGDTAQTEEAAATHKSLMDRENEILSGNTELWEKVFLAADKGMTMQEVVDLLRDEHGWSDSVSNLSNKLQRESLRYVEAVQLADALGYEIVWQRRK